jgi:hypothetical protein
MNILLKVKLVSCVKDVVQSRKSKIHHDKRIIYLSYQ